MSETPRNRGTLLLAIALSLAALAMGLFDIWQWMLELSSSRVSGNILEQVRSSPVTLHRLYAFGAKLLCLYLLLGLVAWLASQLTLWARPAWQRYRYGLVVAWMALLYLCVGLANASLYPWSKTGLWSRVIHDLLPQVVPAWLVLTTLVVVTLLGLLVIRLRHRLATRNAVRATVWGTVAVAAVAIIRNMPVSPVDGEGPASGQPNIIFIGVDSVRPGLVGEYGSLGYTPSLSNFAQEGHRFADAITPLARTYPSWMALLTGRRPARSGVRENLMPRAQVNVVTLADTLSAQGYQTLFATDEVRFSNIDASYGFQKVLAPRVGASDFLLGNLNDFPLTNLLANTVVGKWLFPETYANRAAAVTYDPATFVKRLDEGVRRDSRPLFLAVHLTLPHWPYRWRADEDAVFSRTLDSAYAYLASVVETDRQFDSIMGLLQRKGLLENTLVVVFSDHGEGLNLPADNLVRSADRSSSIGVPVWSSGHGTSVLSSAQYQILLVARAYGIPGIHDSSGVHQRPVSIEDVAPTVLDLVGIKPKPGSLDGQSFAPVLRGTENDAAAQSGELRVRFTESAYSTPSLRQGAADEASLLAEGAQVFRINPETGWVEIRTDLWTELLAVRERAAIGPTQLLAAIPDATPGASVYVLASRSGGAARRLTGPPQPGEDAEATALWNGLHREFAGELGTPAP
jgi:arylsulfatase A-like enzyme